jgi:hypothetical protein
MPAPLKGALVRETARRGSNVNDVAAGILATEFGVSYTPSGRHRKVLAGSSPVLLLRVPQELKDEIHAEASRRDSNANDVILASLADGLGVLTESNRKGRKLMASTNGSKNGAREGQGAGRDQRGELRQLAPPGRVLQDADRGHGPDLMPSTSAGTASRTSSSPPRSTS